jgi:hypothetical protein
MSKFKTYSTMEYTERKGQKKKLTTDLRMAAEIKEIKQDEEYLKALFSAKSKARN